MDQLLELEAAVEVVNRGVLVVLMLGLVQVLMILIMIMTMMLKLKLKLMLKRGFLRRPLEMIAYSLDR